MAQPETAQRAPADEAARAPDVWPETAHFGSLYERYREGIYAYLRSRTTSEEDAADLTQHVFVQALDALPRYQAKQTSFGAWLFRIARNVAVDFHRRHRATVPWDLVPEALQPAAPGDLVTRMIEQDSLARLQQLFVALNAESRELLTLRFAGQLTAPEIAAVSSTQLCRAPAVSARVRAFARRPGRWGSAALMAGVLASMSVGIAPAAATPARALSAAAVAGQSAAGPHLYWTNDMGTTVGRAWLDGSHVNNKFVVGGVDPQRLCGVAIAGKYFYWAIDVPSGGPTIGRAKLDGTGVNQKFINDGAGPVCGVAVAGGHIYWASYATGTIGRANLDGTGVHAIISDLSVTQRPPYDCGACTPNGVAVDGACIYWGEGPASDGPNSTGPAWTRTSSPD